MRVSAVLVACFLIPAAAADQPYRPWSDPTAGTAAGDGRVQEFVDRLNALVDEAEKSRAADPRFLDDLRDLARGFDRPWRTLLLADDFGDGDFTRNPVWRVTAGRFWVERGWGLRSAVEAGPVAGAQGEDRRLSGKEAAAAIFGQILQQAIDPEAAARGAPAGGGRGTAIQTALPLTNAFAIQFDLSSWANAGRLELGPYRGLPDGDGRAPGYVLAYSPGGSLELLRVSARGAGVVDRVPGPVSLEDKKTHRIEWTRRADGRMTVSIDAKQVLDVTDRGVLAPFDGIRIVNRGGDYILGRIAVFGTGPG